MLAVIAEQIATYQKKTDNKPQLKANLSGVMKTVN